LPSAICSLFGVVNSDHARTALGSCAISILATDAQTPAPAPPPPAADQQQFVSYWTTETGWRTELQLRNNQVGSVLTVTPFLRAVDGTETALSPVVVQPQEAKTLDVAAALGNSAPQLIGAYGSLVLRYRAPTDRNLYAVAMIMGVGHSIAFHIDGTGEDQAENVGGREGIWWMPNASAGDYLILTNQGQSPLETNLSVSDASGKTSTQALTLAPRGMARYSIRQILSAAKLDGSYGGIRVSAVSHAGSLDTLHVLFDPNGGFSAVMKMFDYDPRAQIKERDYAKTGQWTLRAPMLALSSPDPALGFPVGTVLQPQLFVRNATSKPIDCSLTFNWRSNTGSGKSAGSVLHLYPNETRRIDVAALQDGKTLPQNAQWASVTLATTGLPDEVVAVAASYDQALHFGAQTPFSDQLAAHWVGSQWEYDPQHDSIITVGNGSTKPTQAAFTILYNQGTQKYLLEQTLQPDEHMWIDIGKLIRENIPDKNGKTLPANLTSGSYEIRDLTNKGVGTLFEGKVIYDKTYGQVTYGCGSCCGYKASRLWYNPLGIPFFSTSDNGVNGLDTCYGQWFDVSDSMYGNWNTANSGVATVDYYGTHTGQSIGSTSSWTSGFLDAASLKTICPVGNFAPGGAANVAPKILFGGCSGTDITNNSANPQPVVVGQQIALCASYGGVSASSQSWSVPGTIVGGFTVAPTLLSGGPTTATVNQQSTVFYWVTSGNSQTVTFTLNYGTNQVAKAQAMFNIAGPSPSPAGAPFVTTQLGQVAINPASPYPLLQFGSTAGSNIGILFTAAANQPAGYSWSFKWINIISDDNVTMTDANGTQVTSLGTGFDSNGTYPSFGNVTANTTNDNPKFQLTPPCTEIKRTFDAQTYLMWNAGLTNPPSIDIPLGSLNWGFSGDAVLNSGTWSFKVTPSKYAAGFTNSSAYPTWSNAHFNGQSPACP
jgi:hypothetical protein